MKRIARNRFAFAGAAAAFILLNAATAMAAPDVCIDTRDIRSSNPSNDGKAIVFTMKNGAVWSNALQTPCPDLAFNGFAWVVRGTGQQVCENMQTLHVLKSGEVCTLGKFTQLKPAKKPG